MTDGETFLAIASYFGAVNAAAFLAFAWDKHCARAGLWRVPERSLLAIAAIGGSVGAIVAVRHLRHKTRKEPFRTILYAIAVAQVVGALSLFVPQVRNEVWQFVQGVLRPGA